jgi:serpin B
VAKTVQGAEIAFSLELMNRLAVAGDSANELISPSSLATALAMLELGAKGTTERGIATALHSAGLSASEQAAGWRSLAALLAGETSTTGNDLKRVPELDIANALWVQKDINIDAGFVRALSREFRTGVWKVDFANELTAATDAINQWTSENTKGSIKQLFSPGALTPTTVLVLADAVFFHSKWACEFETSTTSLPFFLATGKSESVPFMSSAPTDSANPLTVPVATSARYVAVQLPYAGRKLSALVLMPIGTTLPSFLSSLTPALLARIVGSMAPESVDLSMPTFTLRADNQLNGTLSSMGMEQAFGIGADFSKIALYPPLEVHAVEQHAYLQVTPKGTTAAAATGIGVVGTVAREGAGPIVIDHPFLFLVRDNATGTIIFESMVENPAS